MEQYAFPFDKIKKDSNLIIYGAGKIGDSLIRTVEKTQYCNLVCILDQEYEKYKDVYSNVHSPDHILTLNENDYDAILISVSLISRVEKMKKMLLDYGVPEQKIAIYSPIYLTPIAVDNDRLTIDDDGGDILKLAVIWSGGLGDNILACLPLVAFRKLMPQNMVIDLYAVRNQINNMPYVDNIFNYMQPPAENDYDVIIFFHCFTYIDKYKPVKVRRLSPDLYGYFCAVKHHMCKYFSFPSFTLCSNLLTYFQITNKHRSEQHNCEELLPFNRHTIPPFFYDENSYKLLSELGLTYKKYITICTDANMFANSSVKIWPINYYKNLISLIQYHHPDIDIVLVSASAAKHTFLDMTINLCGETNLSEISCLLKHSIMHIGTEGGLIHLNRLLGGKSCCLFGPSSIHTLAYEENINIRSEHPKSCANGCEFIFLSRTGYRCIYQEEEYSPCLKNLTPENVFECITDYLRNAHPISYKMHRTIEKNMLSCLFNKEHTSALVSRENDETVFSHVNMLNKLVVYDANLSLSPINPEAPINLLYAEKLKKMGFSAEYGSVYNIPTKADTYDLVINFTMPSLRYPEYALKELLRIAKPDGCVAVLNSKGKIDIYKKES